MDEYRSELVAVKAELEEVEGEIQQLLERQNTLTERRAELEAILQQSTSSTTDQADWDRHDFKWSTELKEKMGSVFRLKQLRPMQLQTMNVTMSGKDCILIMPTGGGKSLCFQLPALLSKGVTLVVSPLVSLMEDQLISLHGYGVEAAMLNASIDKNKLKQVQDAMLDPRAPLKLLYVTPEKLAKSKRFMAKLEKMYQLGRFSRLVIDEVHCCSQWGNDFRPDYKFLGIMKRQFPDVPILGLTATATMNVLKDVKKILNIHNCQLFRASFNRKNLYYEVREKPAALKDTMDEMQKLIASKFPSQSGIVYTFSRKEAEDITAQLYSRGIKAGCYHADMSASERSRIHRAWIQNSIHVIVATVAFGMGIDKPDVRFVIHHSLSKSMENLYQESGRAGRDDKNSHCIVYYRFLDVFRQSSMVFTEQTGLRNLYHIMDYCTNVSRCRRSLIAWHFGEVWESSQCSKMCDHCDAKTSVEKKDVTVLCQNVIKLLDNSAQTDQRLTATKLLDAWQGRGPKLAQLSGVSTATSKPKLERLLAHLLLNGYIKEDFHFTPYSTISYLVPGPKADLLRTGAAKISLDFVAKATSQEKTSTTESKKKTVNGVQSKKRTSPETSKPKLVLVNESKSAFTDFKRSVSNPGASSTADSQGKALKRWNTDSSGTVSVGKRRKPVIVDSSEDSDGLDFGDTEVSVPRKVKKSSQLAARGDTHSVVAQGPSHSSPGALGNGDMADAVYVLDSDSDME